MTKRKTIVCFTIETGLAHLTRTLAIAEVLHHRGHRVIFAVDRTFHPMVKKRGITPVHLTPSMWGKGSLTTSIEKLKDARFTSSLIQEELLLLKKYQPDVVLVDLRPTGLVSAFLGKYKIAFLTGSTGLPFGNYFPNLGIPKILHRIMSPIIGAFAWRIKRQYLEAIIASARRIGYSFRLQESIRKVYYLVPEFQGYLPQSNNHLQTHYVGPIEWNGFHSDHPPWLDKISKTGRTTYISFGGTGFDARKLVDLSTYLVTEGHTVVVSASSIANVRDFPRHPRLFVVKYIDGDEICQRVDAVICHGGYGTMMQALKNEVPVIAIPYNPDQFIHALRIQELGLGKTLITFTPQMLLRFNWDLFQKAGERVEVKKIYEALQDLLQNRKQYLSALHTFSSKFISHNGNELAADTIERI